MFSRHNQDRQPPYSWKYAQPLSIAQSNISITSRFSVYYLRLSDRPVRSSKIHNTYIGATGGRARIFRNSARRPCPAQRPVGKIVGQIVETKGVHGIMRAFGPPWRQAGKKKLLPRFDSASAAENPGPKSTLVNNALFYMPYFCRAQAIKLAPPDRLLPASPCW